MLLTRRLAFAVTKGKGDKVFVKQGGRLFYDIPVESLVNKFHYKINEEVPKDAVDFPLNNICINNQEDTPEFDNIPKLHHGLHKLLDGKIYKGDRGFGKIPQLPK